MCTTAGGGPRRVRRCRSRTSCPDGAGDGADPGSGTCERDASHHGPPRRSGGVPIVVHAAQAGDRCAVGDERRVRTHRRVPPPDASVRSPCTPDACGSRSSPEMSDSRTCSFGGGPQPSVMDLTEGASSTRSRRPHRVSERGTRERSTSEPSHLRPPRSTSEPSRLRPPRSTSWACGSRA